MECMEKVYWLLLIGEELYNDVETKKHRGEKVRKQNVTKQKTKVAEQMNRIERDQKKERRHERKGTKISLGDDDIRRTPETLLS